jgi:hypothetical protein
MTSWAIVTLPVFVLLSAVSGHRRLAIFLFWWLKPAFERLPLYIPVQSHVRRNAHTETGPFPMAATAPTPTAGQPDLAPPEPEPQFSLPVVQPKASAQRRDSSACRCCCNATPARRNG